jgi:transcription elongation factor GreA
MPKPKYVIPKRKVDTSHHPALLFINSRAKRMASKNTSNSITENFSLGEAATKFLISLTSDKRLTTQQEVNKFVRWYGEKRLIDGLTIPEVSSYAEQINSTATDPAEKLDPVKNFLTYAYKQGFTKIKLASHIKFKKTVSKAPQASRYQTGENISLTAQGYAELELELTTLKSERPRVTEELRKAAADKDFRENAPLEAAREYQGHLEARIRELESSLKKASIIGERQVADHKIGLGDTVVLRDLTSNEQITYTLVDAREANPAKGKISIVSPIGKAIFGHLKGDNIEVTAPAGILPYKIENINQS